MNDISVVVVTENAQDIIRDCLESAKWAAEIVVVDAGSTDKTLEIAAEYTKKIIKVNPALNSGQQWNQGIEAASRRWIFLLESDKRIPEILKVELDNLVKADTLKDSDGYLVATRNYFFGHWVRLSSFYPDWKVYLFKKDTARFEERHKGCLIFQGKSKYLNGYIEHLVYRSLEQCIRKINKDSDRTAEEFFTRQVIFRKRYLITKPLRIFKKQYFRQGGRKEGLAGLVCCLISAFERFLIYAKLWQIIMTRGLIRNS